MKREDFLSFATAAARRATADAGSIGGLYLTSHYRRKDCYRIREPEMRHAFAQEAESIGFLYGIEVPTNNRYRFAMGPGNGRRARYDLVFYPDRDAMATRRAIVELKAGQPGNKNVCPAICKDFVKLLSEPIGEGRAFFHLLMGSRRNSLGELMGRYTAALRGAQAVANEAIGASWFELLVLVQGDVSRKRGPQLYRDGRSLSMRDLSLIDFVFDSDALVEVPLENSQPR
jgi:hypothetical protein